ncbi:SoxR reducing system RseC family protein [Anoxynatronum buryatiense]|uniref:Positive regulator of sigma(E), RseC/MucC n=1 Tax=Anoxynatronum buryatiense TaxID=489973 RepID=A0AA46AIH4_9CLOT|nr:SoxR reducing system RseC family protein [Anoxynatronum buryatiense]SMP49279.1 positive regulator of sigma(E), RseC/MucC [Anoxynatronum buryatiense]
MKQCGLVIETGDQTARVRMQRHTSCAGCNACKMGSSEKPIELEALNPQNVTKGQIVEVEMEHQHVLLAAFLMYVVPLLFLVTGVVIGHYGLQAMGVQQYADLLTAIFAFSMTALSYVFLNRSEKNQKFKSKMLPVITNVIEEAD